MDIKEELTRLPKSWAYVAVNGNKQPYQKDWQNKPLSRLELFKEITAGRAKAIGVVSGPKSGIMFLDHDGKSASEILTEWNLSVGSLPPSWMVTSGRVGRFQLIYKVPEKYWPKIKTRKFKSGVIGDDGAVEQIELRWESCQSVVAGKHPSTDGYRWMEGRSPSDLELAEVPKAIIEKMMEPKKQKPAPVEVFNSDIDKARSLLQSINPSRLDDYDTWLKIGMGAHSAGDSLLPDWIALSQKNSKYEDGECEKKWDSFKRSGISLGTLQKFAKEDGWVQPPRVFPKSIIPTPKEEATPIPTKLEQLTSQELISFLRNQKEEIRFNTFTHSIEMDGKVIRNIELFYLTLAELGYKVTKEMAIDCLLKVAHENEYDPVRLYLEHVSSIDPAYIDQLATTYLRPKDAAIGKPTIYDAMLKATLIAAVRRVFEPGSKHDSACVLQGPQGARKSSFWAALGGPFFSDSLGDIAEKDSVLQLSRSWICEMAELDHLTSRKHAGQIKSFLSRSTDLMRVPYGRSVEEWPRRGIIVGSTNKSDGFLVDETGNRRFHVIPVQKDMEKPIDLDSLQLERDAIWSAAVNSYRKGESSFLSTEQENQIANENMSYLVDSPWQPVIAQWLNNPSNKMKDVTIELLLTEAIEKTTERQTRSDVMAVSNILKSLNYERKKKRVNGTPRWVWFPPCSLPVP